MSNCKKEKYSLSDCQVTICYQGNKRGRYDKPKTLSFSICGIGEICEGEWICVIDGAGNVHVLNWCDFSDQFDSFEAFENAVSECSAKATDEEIEQVSISHFCMCKDGVNVLFEACKDEEGLTSYINTEGETFASLAEIVSNGYSKECQEKQYDCTEMIYPLSEGETVTYSELLAHFETNGTFDDGSKGADGISYVIFGNLNGADFTYNGTDGTVYGTEFFGDSNVFNPISTDFSVTSLKGNTKISYTVYKCI